MVRRFLKWALIALFAPPLLVSSILIAVDTWRKRTRSQGHFVSLQPEPAEVAGAQVKIYTYGKNLYDDMLEAIAQARERIIIETFIWKADKIGHRFQQALNEAAGRGVKVYVVYDTFANLVVRQSFYKGFAPAISVLAYPLISWPWHPFKIQSYARDHRKIMVVDSNVAFVGGYNIGDLYATQWRDTHVRIIGPDAAEIENVFIDFWNDFCGKNRPTLRSTGKRDWDPHIEVHRNDPLMVIFPIRTIYLEAIDRARDHIYLTHAYFVPDGIILKSLMNAARRGVDVRIILPQVSNHVIADWLARSNYTQYLKSGIRLFLYQNAMVHAKTATIDGLWSTIGTANIDRLSMVGNFEINVEFFDQQVAQQMEEIFHQDAKNTRELTLDEWERRPVLYRIAEKSLYLFRLLL